MTADNDDNGVIYFVIIVPYARENEINFNFSNAIMIQCS